MRDINIMPENILNTLARRTEIVKQLNAEERVNVSELSEKFNVSLVTIRKDLAHLEKKGLLIKSRGGAMKRQAVNFDLTFNQKLKQNYKAKQQIGKKAAELILNGEAILFDSGTTTLEVAKNLGGFSELKVITNSLPIAENLSGNKNIELILSGGKLRAEMRSLVGPIAENSLKSVYCDTVFLAVDGIDHQRGIFTPSIEEASICRLMIERSKRVVVVTDSSKFGKHSFSCISSIDKIDCVITDSDIPDDQRQGLLEKGIELIVV